MPHRCLIGVLALLLALGPRAYPAPAWGSTPPLAGWYRVFVALPGYQRSFMAPVRRPQGYRQMARYLWTGDADRTWDVTLVRERGIARRYGDESSGPGWRPVRVGGRRGWLRDYGAVADRAAVRIRLIMPLAPDRALILEGHGLGPWDDPAVLATRFDQGRIASALLAPPRTDFRRTLLAFRAPRVGDAYDDVLAWVGPADADIGSGIHVLVYRLDDGSRVLLGFPDFAHLLYARHERRNGSAEDLVR